jgi:hypothetical protein
MYPNILPIIPTDQTAGQILRDQGIATALENTPELYRSKAADMIRALAQAGQPFTSEDVRSRIGDPPHCGTMGAVITSALRMGLIRSIGFVKTKRPSSRARHVQVFVGA